MLPSADSAWAAECVERDGTFYLYTTTRKRDGAMAIGVLRADSMDDLRACQDGKPGIVSCGRGLNCAFLPDVLPGFSPVGHQGVAYGMCAELFADPAHGCGVGVMTSGVRLVREGPLMLPGLELLALGFASLRD